MAFWNRDQAELEALRGEVKAYRAMEPFAEVIKTVGQRAINLIQGDEEGSIPASVGRALAEFETQTKVDVIEGAYRGLDPRQQWELVEAYFPDLDMSVLMAEERERAERMMDPAKLAEYAKERGGLSVAELIPGRELTLKIGPKDDYGPDPFIMHVQKADDKSGFNVLDLIDEEDDYRTPKLKGQIVNLGTLRSYRKSGQLWTSLLDGLHPGAQLGSTRELHSERTGFIHLGPLLELSLGEIPVFDIQA